MASEAIAHDQSTRGRAGAARPEGPAAETGVSRQSLIGLNAVNFFLAEAAGVAIPFVNDYLKEREVPYDRIGVVTALAGLGVFLAQTPAGWLTDRLPQRRTLLAVASLVLGVCYGLVPLVPADAAWVGGLLFLSGVAQALFVPVLAALALGLVGERGFGRLMGTNQAWNHAGNLAAALGAIAVVAALGINGIFAGITVISVLAAASVYLIRAGEVDEARASGAAHAGDRVPVRKLLGDRRVVILLASVALFHLANAPVMPLVALDVKHLGGSDTQVAAVVLVAQAVMIPVAYLAGRLCERRGRKLVFAVAFAVLPVRIFLYGLAGSPEALVALQALDGIGAGIYGVAVAAVCADLARERGGFNTLMGLGATALSVGGVVGPLASGWLVQHLGFTPAFGVFAGVAAAGAILFIGWMPETRPADRG